MERESKCVQRSDFIECGIDNYRRDSIFYICRTLKAVKDIFIQQEPILQVADKVSLSKIEWLLNESNGGPTCWDYCLCEVDNDFDFWAVPYRARLQISSPEIENLLRLEERTHQTLAQLSSNNFFRKELCNKNFLDHISVLIKQNVLKFENWEKTVLRFLGNISSSNIEDDYILSTGLSQWCWEMAGRSESSIFLEAWRALWNQKGTKNIYLDGIYPLVPPWESESPEVDIVLVHGIKGGASYTWRQHDSEKIKDHMIHRQALLCDDGINGDNFNETDVDTKYSWIWPLDWMSRDLRLNARIIALDYPSNWWNMGEEANDEKDFESISREFIPKLKSAGVGSRPIVWIGHSMGGIIIKKLLEENDVPQGDGSSNSLVRSTTAVIFMAVPHFGSSSASCSCFFEPLLRPSILLRQMRPDNPRLKPLNHSFLSMCQRNSIKVLSLVESRPSKVTPLGPRLLMVPHSQADAGIGEMYKVDASHLDICKPKSKSSDIYLAIKKFLDSICEDILAKIK